MTFLLSSKKTLLLIVIVVVLTVILSSTISIWLSKIYNLRVPSIGTIYTIGVEVYGGDIHFENERMYIDWGKIYLGTSINRSLYVRSISNIETILKLDIANWTFLDLDNKIVAEPAESYMNLTWDYNGTVVQPNATILVTLTLSASSSPDFVDYLITYDVRTFNFYVLIKTSE